MRASVTAQPHNVFQSQLHTAIDGNMRVGVACLSDERH